MVKRTVYVSKKNPQQSYHMQNLWVAYRFSLVFQLVTIQCRYFPWNAESVAKSFNKFI